MYGIKNGPSIFESDSMSGKAGGVQEKTYGQRFPPSVAPAPTHPVFSSQALV